MSEGCRHCYAEQVAARFSDPGQAYEGVATRNPARWTGVLRGVEKHLKDPLRWKRPRRIFVNSMSDLFHEKLSEHDIARVFAIMALARHHTFQVLTKRPGRMRELMRSLPFITRVNQQAETELCPEVTWEVPDFPAGEWPLPNVWLGVSAEDQETVDDRIPLLLDTHAAVRFISAEPLLEGVTLRGHLLAHDGPGYCAECDHGHGFSRCPNTGGIAQQCHKCNCPKFFKRLGHGIDWVIVGGESGRGARPCDVSWIRSIVHQCKSASVPVFVKQLGAEPYRETDGAVSVDFLRLGDLKGGDPAEWPAELRIREFPTAHQAQSRA